MELKCAAVSVVVVVIALVRAQENTQAPIGFGSSCQYSTDCPSIIGTVCKYITETGKSICDCDENLMLTDDKRECVKDIGASCTNHIECTVNYKYTNSRTCGATRVCVCTGNDDCGGGHVVDETQPDIDIPSHGTDTHSSSPLPGVSTRPVTTPKPTIFQAPTRATTRPVIQTAGSIGGKGKSGSSKFMASSSLLLLAAIINKLYYS